MANSDTWMPLYVGDYLADTSHLSGLEHGAYLLLLMAYWRNKGPLPDDDLKLSRIARVTPKEWFTIRATIAGFFVVDEGVWISPRAEKEINKSQGRSETARSSALKRWENRDANAYAKALLRARQLQLQSQKESVSLDSGFAEFYAAYPNKKDPDKARKAYQSALKKVSPDMLLQAAKAYAAECAGREKRYIKHPSSWLNAGSWMNSESLALPLLTAIDGGKRAVDSSGDANWIWRLGKFSEDPASWDRDLWGAPPGHPGCQAPAALLAQYPDATRKLAQ